ncbi:TetR/AcrR family transcriptional regulator [Bacillus norwichensis]|uniref:TetR/AcrR family transcriptional regulator n=1 Tax=Bacillus norwichensis TaxID=2762217 RepID=A0ABR8VMG9_9BACI|nr:TetR/AcrR family transcriptional regulator [Bacillus norwichensis]MBD8005963.1 TetR/AcrR family transcriptional regulator [Bacillus norwichensis]
MRRDRRLQRSYRTRKKLIESAKKVFLESGYHDTTIQKINEEASTGRGTIYSHFPGGKDELLSDLMHEIMNEFYAVADIDFKPKTTEEAFRIIRTQVFDFISLANKHKELLVALYEAISVSKLLRERWEEILNEFINRISSDIQFSKDTNLAKLNIDNEIVARILLFSGERFLWEIVTDRNTKSISEIADNITKIYMFGLYL